MNNYKSNENISKNSMFSNLAANDDEEEDNFAKEIDSGLQNLKPEDEDDDFNLEDEINNEKEELKMEVHINDDFERVNEKDIFNHLNDFEYDIMKDLNQFGDEDETVSAPAKLEEDLDAEIMIQPPSSDIKQEYNSIFD